MLHFDLFFSLYKTKRARKRKQSDAFKKIALKQASSIENQSRLIKHLIGIIETGTR